MKRIIESDMKGWSALTLMIQKRFEKRKSPLVITIGKAPKTHEQLGYLHSEVLPKLAYALHDTGDIRNNSEREAKYWLKLKIGYGQWIEWNGGKVFDPDSFGDADIDVLTRAIDTAMFGADARGVYIQPPKGKKK